MVIVLALVGLTLRPSAVSAATSQCLVYWSSGQFVGNLFDSSTAYIRGAAADIEIEQPALCQTDDAWVATWSMVARDGSTPGWAQIGYEYRNYAPKRYFWQWWRGPGYPLNFAYYGNPTVNTTHNFKVSRYNTDGKLHMFIDGTEDEPCAGPEGFGCPVTDFDPTLAWPGMHGQWFAETRWSGNDVPGTLNDEADFFNVQTRNLDGSWSSHGFISSPAPTYCFWHRRTINASNFEIWTQPVNHDC